MEMNTSMKFERITNEFLLLVRKCIRDYYKPDINEGYQKYDKRELQLMDEFFKIKSKVNTLLCDNTIDMKKITAEKLCQIIDLGKAYINEMEEENKIPNCLLLRNIASYIISLLKAFGITPNDIDDIFAVDFSETTTTCDTLPSTSAYELIMPYVSALTVFRETISELAQQRNVNDIIKECDRIRDKVLPELGILLNEGNSKKPVLALKKWSTSAETFTDKVRGSKVKNARSDQIDQNNISTLGNATKKTRN